MIEETHAGCGFSAELGAVLLEAGFRGSYARVGMGAGSRPGGTLVRVAGYAGPRRIFEPS